jgi:carboxypeptidase family protein/TonB-dependent receptor-like protein
MSNFNPPRGYARFNLFALVTVFALLSYAAFVSAQTGVSTGSIQGTVTDPSSAVVAGAKVTITNKATGAVITTTTSSAGAYNSGSLTPGDYVVRIENKGFKTSTLPLTVEVASTATGNLKLEVGQESQIVEVQASAVSVNTEQATVQGVVTTEQIEQLPISRNFLDLAQLEPGVQIQDGQTFDPTKNGFSSISIGGRAGRTARIEVDGVDISDENVGTTTQNVAMDSIQEFQIGQSSLDLSSELTSSGTVNVTTKSGTNKVHGDAFGFFRDKRAGVANFPGGLDNPYQRDAFGGSIGGPIIKDRLFFFATAERTKQDLFAPVVFGAPFTALSGGYTSPFRENAMNGRLDYQFHGGARLFYKISYDENKAVSSFGGSNYQPFKNHDSTPAHAVGFDFNTGSFTHSFRFAYNHFYNYIADAVTGTSIFNPAPAINLAFGGSSGFASGINLLAPQTTVQTNKEIKYDGSKAWRSHVLRYGFGVNLIDGYSVADFFGSAPQVGADTGAASTAYVVATCGNTATCLGNPLNYPVISITAGNPFGCFSEIRAFGHPCGGLGDHRFQAYFGDSWRALPNLTITAGLRYVRDTGRQDSDVASVPCSATTLITCSGNLLDQFGNIPGLGNRVRQPNLNFAPQLGIAWDPLNNGKTVIRAGAGLYYDNTVFNNILFDRVVKLPTGEFNTQAGDPCAGGGVFINADGSQVTTIDGFNIGSQICGTPGPSYTNLPIGQVQAAVGDLQKQYQANAIALGPKGPNGAFLGNLLSGLGSLFAPNFQTPRSVQMNIGIQRQIHAGTILSVDYVRNVATHYLLGHDTNHVGDAKYLDVTAAQNAIIATTGQFGCAGGFSSAAIDCAITAGAAIADFAGNGLDSAGKLLAGFGPEVFGLTPPFAAFPGINPAVGRNTMYFPAGRSVYNGLQMSLRSQIQNPVRGIKGLNLQVSYALSRFESNVPGGIGDQDFLPVSANFNNPSSSYGPASQDRTHQVSFGTIFDLAHAGRLSFIGHFDSPLSNSLFLTTSGGLPGEIFRTDFNGDGEYGGQSQTGNSAFGDVLPGTNLGAFGRSITASNLGAAINNYNSKYAGTLTPAGQALVTHTLFTQTQLQSLGAVMPTLASPPAGNIGLGWLRTLDVTYAYPIKIRERFEITPSVSAFNVFDFANFDGPTNKMSSILDGNPGAPNGKPDRSATRIGVGSGIFTLGGPRQLEFGLKITF